MIIYQQQEGRGIGIINKIRAYALQDAGADTIEANTRLGLEVDLRQYEQCAEILLDLGLREVRLLRNNPEKIRALKASGLEVVARVALEVPPTEAASNYLRTKKEKMGTTCWKWCESLPTRSHDEKHYGRPYRRTQRTVR